MRWERTAAGASSATPDRLWAMLLDGARWSEWNRDAAWMTVEGPLAAGSVLTMKPSRSPQTAFRIEEVDPPRRLVLVLTFGPLATLRLRWEARPHEDGGASLEAAVAIGGPAAWLLSRAARRVGDGLAENLARLAARAENEDATVADRVL